MANRRTPWHWLALPRSWHRAYAMAKTFGLRLFRDIRRRDDAARVRLGWELIPYRHVRIDGEDTFTGWYVAPCDRRDPYRPDYSVWTLGQAWERLQFYAADAWFARLCIPGDTTDIVLALLGGIQGLAPWLKDSDPRLTLAILADRLEEGDQRIGAPPDPITAQILRRTLEARRVSPLGPLYPGGPDVDG